MHLIHKLCSTFLAACLLANACLATPAEKAPVRVATLSAGAGEKISGFIEVPAGDDPATRIPVTIINGAGSGPTLALIAGTHGYEYAPILALQALAQSLDPAVLGGAIIIVHVANMPAFLGRNVYYNPIDHKNLNRVYPGAAHGSSSERIAYTITTQVIAQADYLVDMHSGDGNESLRPYIYMPETGDSALDARIKAMALAFGIDHIAIDRTAVTAPDKSIFTDMTGLSRGIPSMTTEAGGAGATDAHWVDINITGVNNLLQHLGMAQGTVETVAEPVWLEDYTVVTSPDTGVFKPVVGAGDRVAKGAALGVLVDFFGRRIADITAPFAGVINYVIVTPPITRGEPLVSLSHVKQAPTP